MFDVAPEKGIRCGEIVTAHWRQFSALFLDGADNRVWCFFDYGYYDFRIGRNRQNFILRLNIFNLLDILLRLDCELLIRKFSCSLTLVLLFI